MPGKPYIVRAVRRVPYAPPNQDLAVLYHNVVCCICLRVVAEDDDERVDTVIEKHDAEVCGLATDS